MIALEKEKLRYFILAYRQKIVLTKTGDKQVGKRFLGYEFSHRRGHQGIHATQREKSIDDCTQLFDPNQVVNRTKANYYVYQNFLGKKIHAIDPVLSDNVSLVRLSDMMTFDRVIFEKVINLNGLKKVKIEVKREAIGKLEQKLIELVKVEHQQKVALGDICAILNGYAFKRKEYVKDGVRIIRIKNVQSGKVVEAATVFYSKNDDLYGKYALKANDLLLTLTGNVGRVGFLPKNLLPAYLNQRVACLRLQNTQDVSIRFLYLLLNTSKFEQACIEVAHGLAQKNLSTTWLATYKIPLPPKATQDQIVEEIDQLEQEEEVKRERVKRLHTQISKLINGREFWKKEVLIPLSEITTIQKGTTITKAKAIEGNIPVIAGGKSPAYFHNQANRSGHIITVSASGSAGFVNYFTYPIFASDCNTIQSKDEDAISTKLIYLFLKSIQSTIYKLQKGQIQPHVYKEDLDKIKIPLLPKATQEKIVQQIRQLEVEIRQLEADLAETRQAKEAVLQKYL